MKKNKDFMDIEYQGGVDQELHAKQRRGVDLEYLNKQGSFLGALTDGIAVGFDHAVEYSLYQKLKAEFAAAGGSSETISPQLAKKYFDLDIDEDISFDKAVVLGEMKKERVKNLRDLSQHTGLDALAGFGGAMIGNMISPTAWFSGVALAKVVGGAARGLSNTALYLKAMEKLNKPLRFARTPKPHTALKNATLADEAILVGKELRGDISNGMGMMKAAVFNPKSQEVIYNGVGNLLEELGVQSLQASQGHKYELGPQDMAFAVFAPAMFTALGTAIKGAVKSKDPLTATIFGNPHSRPDNAVDRAILKEAFDREQIDMADISKELERMYNDPNRQGALRDILHSFGPMLDEFVDKATLGTYRQKFLSDEGALGKFIAPEMNIKSKASHFDAAKGLRMLAKEKVVGVKANQSSLKQHGFYSNIKDGTLNISKAHLDKVAQHIKIKGFIEGVEDIPNLQKSLDRLVNQDRIAPPRRRDDVPLTGKEFQGEYYTIKRSDLKDITEAALDPEIAFGQMRALEAGIRKSANMATNLKEYTDNILYMHERFKAQGKDFGETLGISEMEAIRDLIRKYGADEIQEQLTTLKNGIVSLNSHARTADVFPQLASSQALKRHINKMAAEGRKNPEDVTLNEVFMTDIDHVIRSIDEAKLDIPEPKKRYASSETKGETKFDAKAELDKTDPDITAAVKEGLRKLKNCEGGGE